MISWKWIAGLLILGLAELLLVIQLHQWVNVKMLVLIYLTATVVGFVFLKIMERRLYSKQAFQAINLSKKAEKRMRQKIKNGQVLVENEQHYFKFTLSIMIFTFALLLIVMPGLLTDFIGMILVVPGFLNKLLDKSIIDYNLKALRNSPDIK